MALVPFPFPVVVSIGLILSLYALFVELHPVLFPEDTEFTPLCDIEAIKASCSSVFSMPEGHMVSYWGFVEKGHVLDVPNAALGAAFYSVMLAIWALGKEGTRGVGLLSCWVVE